MTPKAKPVSILPIPTPAPTLFVIKSLANHVHSLRSEADTMDEEIGVMLLPFIMEYDKKHPPYCMDKSGWTYAGISDGIWVNLMHACLDHGKRIPDYLDTRVTIEYLLKLVQSE